ncbi:hypothetical protein NLM23_27220 [Bradyrhizobium cajani]|nr:hypothetical protein [Bradyrhizobium cajani]MCP3372739.1 hypothetical protein [Bradyrhizobium cajani]
MVATGALIKLLFGIPYSWSVIIVGTAMLIYVLFGDMLAATWLQVVKAAPDGRWGIPLHLGSCPIPDESG